jgi:hypothetical protein
MDFEEIKELEGFCRNKGISQDSLVWLGNAIQEHFGTSNFEVCVITDADMGISDNKDDGILSIKINGDIPTEEFGERRHNIYDHMINCGLTHLYRVSCIFQRRTGGHKCSK